MYSDSDLTFRSLWRHKKTGELYTYQRTGLLKSSNSETDNTEYVVYCSISTGRLFIALKSEFLDGRFELVKK